MQPTPTVSLARRRARVTGSGLSALLLAGGLALGGLAGATPAGAAPAPITYPPSGPAEPVYPDLSLWIDDAPDPVPSGGTVTYTLTVGNEGELRANGIVVRQNLPAGTVFQSASGSGFSCAQAGGVVTCSGGALMPGRTATITTKVTAPVLAAGGTLTTTGLADPNGTIREWDEGNNAASATTTVLAPPPPPLKPDLVVPSMSDAPDPVARGAQVTYTFRVRNDGQAAATGVFAYLSSQATFQYVSSSSPDGWTCMNSAGDVPFGVHCWGGSYPGGATLQPGQAATVSVTARAPGASGAFPVTATADWANTVVESNEGNNSLTVTTAVQ